jgi:chemotaxis protein histidine kinase CheA
MVRKAIDHGIKTPDVRHARNNLLWLLLLRAFHDRGSVVVQLIDDGAV